MKKYFFLLILLIIGLLPLIDLLNPGLPITHDGQDHVARIANFYKNLEEGNIIPRWAPNLNWGYGHPILMFLYPMPSYFASVFHFFGFNLVDSVKLVFGLAFILSGFAFYLWLKTFLPKTAALFGASLYLIAPYRFIDLYVRGAIGEHTAFLFIPLVFYFIKKLSEKYSKWNIMGGAFSLAGLILSHNAISLMFLPLIFFYSVYLFEKKKKEYVKSLVYLVILGLGISSFFWIPAFFEGKYTLRDIVTFGEYKTRFVNFSDFITGTWNYGGTAQFSKQIGIVQWIMVILSLPFTLFLYKRRNRLWLLGFGSIFIFFITLFLMLPESNFIWERITVLQKFQFPWRLLSVSVFITALLGGILASERRFGVPLIILVLVFLLFINKDYWKAQDYKVFPESFFTTIYNGTTDTGESSPIWSVRFMEEKPKSHLEVIEGEAEIKELKRSSTHHEYFLSVKIRSRLRENTLYFPGWSVLVDGKKTPVEFQDPKNRGLMTFYSDAGKHNLIVKFEETKLRQVANLLSLLSVIFAFIFMRYKKI